MAPEYQLQSLVLIADSIYRAQSVAIGKSPARWPRLSVNAMIAQDTEDASQRARRPTVDDELQVAVTRFTGTVGQRSDKRSTSSSEKRSTSAAASTRRSSTRGGLYLPYATSEQDLAFATPHTVYVSRNNGHAHEILAQILMEHISAQKVKIVLDLPVQNRHSSFTFFRRGSNRRSSFPSGPSRAGSREHSASDSGHGAALPHGPAAMATAIVNAGSAAMHQILKTADVHMVVLLFKNVFVGPESELFLADLRRALSRQIPILLLHEVQSCMFDHLLDTCPRDLLAAGLFNRTALQLWPGPHAIVSSTLLCRALGARPLHRSLLSCIHITSAKRGGSKAVSIAMRHDGQAMERVTSGLVLEVPPISSPRQLDGAG